MDDKESVDLNQLSGFEIKPNWAENLGESKSGEETRDYADFETGKGARKGKGRDWNRDSGDRRGPQRGGGRDDRRGGNDRRGGWDRNREGRGRNDGQYVKRVNPLKGKTVIDLQPNPVFLKGIADTIKQTGHAYSLFDLSKYFLSKAPQAIDVKFTAKDNSGIKLVYCPATGTVWLNREEAVDHLVDDKAFEEYYEIKEVELGEPKGSYSVIGVCTMSDTIIGPPNHHDYQPRLRALHRRRFGRMAFERFQSRIEMRRDEETIAKWKEQESKQIHYVHRKGTSEEPEVLKSLDDAKRHFLVHHGDTVFKTGNTARVSQVLSKRIAQDLFNIVRGRVTFLERSPLEFVRILSRSLEKSGLCFFKRDRKTIYVSAHRPRPLPAELILSDRLGRIAEHLRQHDGVRPVDVVTVISGAAIPMPDGNPTPSPEQRETLKDLRWLVMEGYVVELSSGELHLIERKAGFVPTDQSRPRRKKKPRQRKPHAKDASSKTGDAKKKPEASSEAKKVTATPKAGTAPKVKTEPVANTATEVDTKPEVNPESKVDVTPEVKAAPEKTIESDESAPPESEPTKAHAEPEISTRREANIAPPQNAESTQAATASLAEPPEILETKPSVTSVDSQSNEESKSS